MIIEEGNEMFKWDDDIDIPVAVETTKTEKEKVDDTEKKNEPAEKKKEEPPVEVDFSKEDEDEEEVIEELELIKELGLEIASIEEIHQAFESKIEERAKEMMENIFEELDEDAVAFLKFKKAGGKTEDFISAISTIEVNKLNPDKDKEADTIIRMQLQSEGMDEDEIADRIEYLEDKGTKSAQAKKYKEKMVANAEKMRNQLQKQAEDEEAERQEKAKKYREDLLLAVDKVKEVSGLVIPDKAKKRIKDSLTKATEKVGKVYITPFQKKLNEAVRNPDKLILLAHLLETDFNFEDIKIQVKTQEAKELKGKLSHTVKPLRNTQKATLADFF